MSTPIKREDIRKGDRVRRIVTDEFEAHEDFFLGAKNGETYELIERPVQLPTAPGFYLDNQRDVWKLCADGRWFCETDRNWTSREAECAPFTLLRPVAEVAAEVLAEVGDEFGEWLTETHAYLARSRIERFDAIAARWATK